MFDLKTFLKKNPVIQSPMAGCTDLAFRLLAREFGLKLAFLEMISSDALVRNNRKTLELMKTRPKDRPLGAQLVGANPENLAEAARILEDLGFDVIDLNLGCPVPKVVKTGAGSALMKDPVLSEKIFRSVRTAVKKIPVTVKMRRGYKDESGKEALRISRLAEDCGLQAVTIHGRTQPQGYQGKADWGIVAEVKKAVKIPVIGNGDILTGAQAAARFRETGCDAVMIGRGALGNPWLYKEILLALKGKTLKAPSLAERKKTALRHFDLELRTESSERGVILKSRRLIAGYFKHCPGIAHLRGEMNRTLDRKTFRKLIRDFE